MTDGDDLTRRLDRAERRLEQQRVWINLLAGVFAAVALAALIPGVGAVLAVALWAGGIAFLVIAFIGSIMWLLERVDRMLSERARRQESR